MRKELPKGWIETNLDLLCEIKSGGTPSRSNSTYWNNGTIPWIKISDIKEDDYNVDKSTEFISEIGLNNSAARIFPKGTILFTIFATIGRIGILNIDATTNQAIAGISPSLLINKKYLVYSLKELSNSLQKEGKGVAQKNINQAILKATKIPLPPRAEQDRIVAKVDALMAQHAAIQQAMERIPQLLKDFRQQVLTQAVTGKLTEEWRVGKELDSESIIEKCQKNHWNDKQLAKYKSEVFSLNIIPVDKSWSITSPGVLCEKIVDGTHKTPKYKETGVKFLSAKNIRDWYIDEKGCKYISIEEHKELLKRCNPKVGSLLITKSGTIGRMAVIRNMPDYSLFESVAVMTPLVKEINPYFLGYSLKVFLENGGNEKHVKGTAVQHLHLTELRILPIQLPSYLEQQEIVRRVESLFEKATAIEQRYEQLKSQIDSLPQAILHKAFKGELVEQLDGDGSASELLEEIEEMRNESKGNTKSRKR